MERKEDGVNYKWHLRNSQEAYLRLASPILAVTCRLSLLAHLQTICIGGPSGEEPTTRRCEERGERYPGVRSLFKVASL